METSKIAMPWVRHSTTGAAAAVFHRSAIHMYRLFVIVACGFLASCASTRDSERKLRAEAFQQEMIPKIGQAITMTGKLIFLKSGWWLSCGDRFDGAGAFIENAKYSDLGHLNMHMVEVTGVLRRYGSSPQELRRHQEFFFNMADVTVTEVSAKTVESH